MTPNTTAAPINPKHRLRALLYLILVLLGLALMRLADWQLGAHPDLRVAMAASDAAAKQTTRQTRGLILDRNGLLLAMDVWGYEVSASPSGMGDEAQRRRWAEQLALLLQQPTGIVWEKLANPSKDYVVLERLTSLQTGDAIEARRIAGVRVEPTLMRQYPLGAFAAHTLGFVNFSNRGVYGIEEEYQDYLTGAKDMCRARVGAQLARLSVGVRELQPSANACDLVLTLDWAIQDLIERELIAAIERTKSAGGSIVVVEPQTGQILAMAAAPSFNPNRFYETSDGLFNHPAISLDYEPGSVLKIMTMAAGLDTDAFAPNSTVYDSGEIVVGGRKIRNWDNKGHGRVTMTDVLAKSLNVGAAYISVSLGEQKFYNYLTRFGFAKITNVDLANEVSGQVRFPTNPAWHISDLGTNSFGQGMTVTPLQVVMMASVVANDGVLMKPYIVESIIAQGQRQTIQPQPARRVIASDTARTLSRMLADAIERETLFADIPGVRIAGKTGTASIPNPRTGQYDLPTTIASFVGWVPYDNPKFVMLVKLDKPQTSIYGSVVAAPVFRDITKKLLLLLDEPVGDGAKPTRRSSLATSR
jgi:cell division protein FtsI/penicillin-binding protein 2